MKVSTPTAGGAGAAFELQGGWSERNWANAWFMSDRIPRVIVSRTLRVLAANRRALEMIAATDVLSICDGQLLATRCLAGLRQAVATAGAQECAQLVGEVDSGVLLTAVAASDGPDAPVFLTLHDLSVPSVCDWADLRPVFDLTSSEQSVILGLLRGQSAGEIADETRRSVLTVRTHIKRAHRKIGVRSLAQLFARLLPYTSMRSAAAT